jgi:hypothetical protein
VDRARHARSLERRAPRGRLLRRQGCRRTTRRGIPGHAVVLGNEEGLSRRRPRRRHRRQGQDDWRLRTARAGDRRGARSARHGRDLRR